MNLWSYALLLDALFSMSAFCVGMMIVLKSQLNRLEQKLATLNHLKS